MASGSGSGTYNKRQLMNLWVKAGGDPSRAGLMASIALAESGGKAGIVNSIGATGLWQIHPGGSQYKDPLTNARTAVSKFKTQGLQAWEAYTNGAYKRYVGPAKGTGVLPSASTDGLLKRTGEQQQPDSQGLSAAVATLLAAGQKPQIASAGIAAPAFSARAAMPQGAQLPQGGGGPVAQGPNVDGLLALVVGQQQGTSQGTESGSQSPQAPSAQGSGGFGKSHSPLLELIHKGDKPYAVKNGKVVDPSVYSSVWDGHADHVHLAAGPKTVVQLGNLAQKMGLHVGENPHFGGVNPVHAKNSYHYKGEAIDVSGDPRKMNQFAAQVERLYGLGG